MAVGLDDVLLSQEVADVEDNDGRETNDTQDSSSEGGCAGASQKEQLSIQQKLSLFASIIESHHDADFFAYAGDIGVPADKEFHKKISAHKKKNKIILWLSTYGGLPDSAFRMGKILQNHYEHITILADDYCKSSGTLLSLCADEIWMTDCGEFGPLDIQLMNKEEFLERNSGLDSLQALSTLAERSSELLRTQFVDIRMGARLSTKQALDAAARVTIGLLSPIYAQLEPMRLGEVSRSMQIAYEYGKRLDRGNLKPGALEHLIAKYPSHSYVVDRCEAEDRLFNKVNEPSAVIWELIEILKPYTSSRVSSQEPFLLHLGEFLNIPQPSQEDTLDSGSESIAEDATEVVVAMAPDESSEEAKPLPQDE